MLPKGRDPDWRHNKRFIPFSAFPDGGESFAEIEESGNREKFTIKLSQDIDFALSQLQQLDRKVFELHYGLDGDYPMNKKQVAELLRISRPTVYKCLERAKVHLRTQLKNYSPNNKNIKRR